MTFPEVKMRVLWIKCDEILPGCAIAVAFLSVALSFIVWRYEQEQVPKLDKICSMAESGADNLQNFQEKGMTAFVIGYTGEVGKELVKALFKTKPYKKVILVGRRTVNLDESYGDYFEQAVVDFDNLELHSDVFKDVDHGYSCLGTTRAVAGREGFIKVDHDYVLKSAQLAKEGGCKHFSLVSSTGADKNSSFLYPRTKGQIEEALKTLHFDNLSIFRPGILMCDRQESRPGEYFARTLLKPLSYIFPTAISIPTSTVAMALINDAITPNKDKIMFYDNRAIHFLSGVTSKTCK